MTAGTRGAAAAWLAGWRVFVPVTIVAATAQAATVLGSGRPAPDPVFALIAVVSLLVAGVALAIVAAGARAAVDRSPFRVPGPRLLLWTLGLLVVASAAAVVFLPAAPLVAVAGAFLLPPVAAGGRTGFRGFAVFRGHPVRAVLATLGLLLAVVIAWLSAVVLGLFVTGPLGAGLTWLVFGVVASAALCLTTALGRRVG